MRFFNFLASVLLLGLTHNLQAEKYDFASIVASFGDESNRLSGWVITAEKIDIKLNAHSSLQAAFSGSTNLSAAQKQQLATMLKEMPGAVTNIQHATYRFGAQAALATIHHTQSSTSLIETKILSTREHILELRSYARVSESDATRLPDGIIRPVRNGGGGWPIALGKATLADLMRESTNARTSLETLSDGQRACVVDIPAADGDGPIGVRRLVLAGENLKPLEITSRAKDGTIYSRTALRFDEKPGPGICTEYRHEEFGTGGVSRIVTWKLESISREPSPFEEISPEEFFPPLTSVVDQRVSPSVSYRMGSRLPSPPEMVQMLTNKSGVARYEAATLSRRAIPSGVSAGSAPETSHAKPAARAALLLAISLLSLLLGFCGWKMTR